MGTSHEDQSSYSSECEQPVHENGHIMGPMDKMVMILHNVQQTQRKDFKFVTK
jgi:hypothetical protein